MSSDNTFKTVEFDYKVDSADTINISFTADELDDIMKSNMTTYSTIGAQGSNYTISTSAGANGTWGYSSITSNPIATYDNKLHVKGDTLIEGDLKVDGISFKETIESINKRLAILQPNPEKLKHFEALQKAYEHYKTLEALCELPKKEDK